VAKTIKSSVLYQALSNKVHYYLAERGHYINTGPGDWGLKEPRTKYMRTQSFKGCVELEVFSEDKPHAVLWYNCGTK